MNPRLPAAVLLVFCFFSLVSPFVRESNAQWASSSSRDFGGENRGDFIMLQWDPTDSAAWYFVYVAYSSNGPWSLLFETDNTPGGGAKVHMTPDARTRDLCYKVDAKDATGTVIKTYEPICVPKYAEKK
jgi:hypothetical protein